MCSSDLCQLYKVKDRTDIFADGTGMSLDQNGIDSMSLTGAPLVCKIIPDIFNIVEFFVTILKETSIKT